MKKILFTLTLSISCIIYANESPDFYVDEFIQQKSIENVKAYPNPFSTETLISFTTSKNQEVILTLKNLLGKTIFKNEYKTKKGKNSIVFYRNKLVPGMYIYSLQTDADIITKRLVIK